MIEFLKTSLPISNLSLLEFIFTKCDDANRTIRIYKWVVFKESWFTFIRNNKSTTVRTKEKRTGGTWSNWKSMVQIMQILKFQTD